MNRDYFLINTHVGARVGPLLRGLLSCQDVAISSTPMSYTSALDLYSLVRMCSHNPATRIVGDIIVYNHSLQTYDLGKVCNFIYYLDEPVPTIARLIQKNNFSVNKALDYYAFRLQRLVETAKYTPKSIILTWGTLDDEHGDRISSMFKLSRPVRFSIENNDVEKDIDPLPIELEDSITTIYNKYLKQLRKNLSVHAEQTLNIIN